MLRKAGFSAVGVEDASPPHAPCRNADRSDSGGSSGRGIFAGRLTRGGSHAESAAGTLAVKFDGRGTLPAPVVTPR